MKKSGKISPEMEVPKQENIKNRAAKPKLVPIDTKVYSLSELEKKFPIEFSLFLMLRDAKKQCSQALELSQLTVVNIKSVAANVKSLHLIDLKKDDVATTLLHFILDQIELVDITILLLEKFGYHLVNSVGMIPLAHYITTHELVFNQKIGPLEEFWKKNTKAKHLLNLLLKNTNMKTKFVLYGDSRHAMTIVELFIHDRNTDGDVELFKYLVEAERKQGDVCVEDLLWRCSWYFCVDILKGFSWKIRRLDFNCVQKANGRSLLFPLLRNLTYRGRKEEVVNLWMKLVGYMEENLGENRFSEVVNLPDSNNCTLLMYACKQGSEEIVTFLLNWFEKINQIDNQGRNCLDYAIDSQNEPIVNLILKTNDWQSVMSNAIMTKKTMAPFITPMRKLVEQMPAQAEFVLNRCMKIKGVEFQNVAKQDLDKDDLRFDCNVTWLLDDYGITDWCAEYKKILAKENEIDNGTSLLDVILEPNYQEGKNVIQTYRAYSENTQLLYQNHVLACMIRHKRERLLAHPVITAVNNHLWDSGGFWYFYISMAMYLAFLCMINTFAFIMPPNYAVSEPITNRTQECNKNGLLLYTVGITEEHQAIWHKGECYTENNLLLSEDPLATSCDKDNYNNFCYSFAALRNGLDWILIVYSGVRLVGELMNLSYERMQYLRKIPNLIELALYITTIMFVLNIDPETDLPTTWQWQAGVVCLWLSWTVFFIKLMNIPKMGYYLIMLGKVTMTWIYFGMIFVVFVFAFTVILYLLFMNSGSFHTLFLSLMSTIFMLILSYNWYAIVPTPCDIYNNTEISEGPEAECFDYYGMSAGYQIALIIIGTLVIAMPIVLVNMLIALSVDDVCSVSQEANLKKVAIRVRQSLSSIYKLPNKYRVDTMNVPGIKFILNPKYYRSWWDKVLNNEIKLEELEQKSVVVELYEEVNNRSTTIESHISDLSAKLSNLTEKVDDQDAKFKSLFTRLNNGIEKQRPGARKRFLTHN